MAVGFGLLSLAVITLFPSSPSVTAWAVQDGPIFVVDAAASPEEDQDRDHHFKTLTAALKSPFLGAYDTIIVEPGRYEGDLKITVEGLKIRSSRGAPQTIIAGRIDIRAQDTLIEGFSIEGPFTGAAITISADGVTLKDNLIHHATVGVIIEGPSGISLEGNQIYNHVRDGLVVRNSWGVRLSGNELRGNGGMGAWIEGASDVLIEGNTITLNGLGGLWLKDCERAQITRNTLGDNGLVGIVLERTSRTRVEENKLSSNEAGILLLEALNNEVKGNEIRKQRTAGLVLKNGSQGNSVEENLIQGNQGRGASGVRLAGGVFNNYLKGNRVLENGIGFVLSANETGGPTNNLFEANEIAHSDGVGIFIEGGAERNRWLANKIYQNLGDGIASSGLDELYEGNEIYDNGGAGVVLRDSEGAGLEGNRIYANGAEGVRLESATNALLSANEITRNVQEGVKINESLRLRFLNNTITENGSSGLSAQGSEDLALKGNQIRANSDYGASFQEAEDLVLEENEIEANGAGGVRLEGVQRAGIEANRLTENLHFGLWVLRSEAISARRNFWGDGHGPAGAFAGRGNAALGLKLEQLTPWLPAEPDELLLSSVSALMIDSPQGTRIEFDASDRLGLILEIYHPGRGEPGRTELLSKGIIVAARYAARPEGAPPLGLEMAFYTITVEGIDAGTAEITLFYEEEDEPVGLDPEKLRIFVLDDGEWRPLPGGADPQLQRVTGEISVEQLDGRLIALGMLTRADQPLSLLRGIQGLDGWGGPLFLLVPASALTLFYLLYACAPRLPRPRRTRRQRTPF